MIIWIDAQLSPSIAAWINRSYQNIQAQSVRSLDLQRADDKTIFDAAKQADAVIISYRNYKRKLFPYYYTHSILID
ncbi:MAG: DUF5615 family PIN-like protein [Chlorobium sp.]